MSIIKQVTGHELEQAIVEAFIPYVAWFDGTAETGGISFIDFSKVMERFALCVRPVTRVVLVNVEVWEDTAARYGVIGAPELVLFKDGRKSAHQIGTATLTELLLWAGRHVSPSMEIQKPYRSRRVQFDVNYHEHIRRPTKPG